MKVWMQRNTVTQDQYYKTSIVNLRSFQVLQIFCTWGSVFMIYIVNPSWKLKLQDVFEVSHAHQDTDLESWADTEAANGYTSDRWCIK